MQKLKIQKHYTQTGKRTANTLDYYINQKLLVNTKDMICKENT